MIDYEDIRKSIYECLAENGLKVQRIDFTTSDKMTLYEASFTLTITGTHTKNQSDIALLGGTGPTPIPFESAPSPGPSSKV